MKETNLSKAERIEQIAEEIRVCTKCKLHQTRKMAVPGEGSAKTEILFIGEGPGFYENEQGRPFVGAAGKFLTELLASIGLNREDVFITNVVKCRPPGNRDPEYDELSACGKYLERQMEAIEPHIIVTLGRISMGRFLPDVRIGEVHGQARWVDDKLVVAMYHPAAALHQPALRSVIEKDFSRLPEYIKMSKAKKEQGDAADFAEQESAEISTPEKVAEAPAVVNAAAEVPVVVEPTAEKDAPELAEGEKPSPLKAQPTKKDASKDDDEAAGTQLSLF